MLISLAEVLIPSALLILLSEAEGWMMSDGSSAYQDVFTGTQKSFNEHVCTLFIYTDPFMWRHVHRSPVLGGGNSTKTKEIIEGILKNSVERANRVFSMAEFYGSGQTIHKGVHFALVDYLIDDDSRCFSDKEYCDEKPMPMGDMCNEPILCDNSINVFCNNLTTLRFYLHAFSAYRNYGMYCLAYAFTYRNIGDFQGIAWVKGYDQSEEKTFTHYGYCSVNDDQCKDESLEHYFRNTGVVNFYTSNGTFSTGVGASVFAHEIGHSLGGTHDDEKKTCNPQLYDLYLMTGKSMKIIGQENKDTLSACSSREIGRNLDKITCWDRNGQTQKKNTIFSIFVKILNAFESYCSTEPCKIAQENLAIVTGIAVIVMLMTSLSLCYCYRVLRANHRREQMLKRQKALLESEITSMWSVDYVSISDNPGIEQQTEFLKACETKERAIKVKSRNSL